MPDDAPLPTGPQGSSPIGRGGVGFYIERELSAFYLLALLAGTEARGMPSAVLESVRFQLLTPATRSTTSSSTPRLLAPDHPLRPRIDGVLGRLVAMGVSEAHNLEQSIGAPAEQVPATRQG